MRWIDPSLICVRQKIGHHIARNRARGFIIAGRDRITLGTEDAVFFLFVKTEFPGAGEREFLAFEILEFGGSQVPEQ